MGEIWLRDYNADSKVKTEAEDFVNRPKHYTQGEVECFDALMSAVECKPPKEAVLVAKVIKYLWRYETKNGLQDVKKAQWYFNKLIEILEKKNG